MSTRPSSQAQNGGSQRRTTQPAVPLKFRTALASQSAQKTSPRTPTTSRASRLLMRRTHASGDAPNGPATTDTPARSRTFGKRALGASKEADPESGKAETLPESEVRAVWDHFLALGMPIRELNLTFEDFLTLASVPVVARVRLSSGEQPRQPWDASGNADSLVASSSSSHHISSITPTVSFTGSQVLPSDLDALVDEDGTVRVSAPRMQTFGHLLVEMKRLLVGRMEAAMVRDRLQSQRSVFCK